MTLSIHRAGPGDETEVLGLFDRAVAWLASQGFTGQWGTEPWTGDPRRQAMAAGWLSDDDAWFARTVDGEAAGFVGLGPALDYVPAAEVPEVYVRALVTSRAPGARGAGRLLLDHAMTIARARGVEQVRVDCYAGNGGRLVAFYESCCYERIGSFTHGEDWTGALLVRPVG